MKLLVLSHSCVTPVNQALFAAIERLTGWSVGLVMPENWKTEYGALRQAERGAGFAGKVYGLPVHISGNVPLHFYKRGLDKILSEFNPDVIYAHHEPYGLATAQLYHANRKTVQKPIGFFTWQNLSKRYPVPIRQLEKQVYRSSSFAISGSESAKEVLRAKGFSNPVEVVPAGIDPSDYKCADSGSRLRSGLLNDGEDFLIGYVGRVAEEKGMEPFLHALSQINENKWRLVVIGSGSFENQFDKLARDLGLSASVSRLGYIPHTEAPAYLNAFDVLVLPSLTRENWKEQFGRVLIEAAAAGTAVIGSNSGEIPHVIKATGGGLVFEEGNPKELAESLTKLLQDPSLCKKLGKRGQDSVLKNYTNDSLAQRLAEVFDEAHQRNPM